MSKKRRFSISAELFFVIASLFSGIFLCLFIPIGSGFDEDTHTDRIWEISDFDFIPNNGIKGIAIPRAFHDVSYHNRYFVTPITVEEIKNSLSVKIVWNDLTRNFTRSIYFPIMYFPAAFIMGVMARVLKNIPVVVILLMIRLVNLFIYVILTFIAIKITPIKKWLLAILALTPMVLFQSSIVSIDYFKYGVVFLFIGWILHLCMNHNGQMTNRDLVILIFLIFGIASLKPNEIFLLFLIFLLPRNLFRSLNQKLFVILITIATILVVFVGWNLLVYKNFYMNSENVNAMSQTINILAHPMQYIKLLFNQFSYLWTYIKDGIAAYGYYNGSPPSFVYYLYILILLFTLIFEHDKFKLPRKFRWMFIIIGLVEGLITISIIYLTMNEVGSSVIIGVHGKYFMTSLILLVLGISNWFRKPLLDVKIPVLVTLPIILLGYAFGLIATYYIPCGISMYTPGLCYQPEYKNWAPSKYYTENLPGDYSLSQTFLVTCNNLSEVRIFLSPVSPSGGSIIISLYEYDSLNKIVEQEYTIRKEEIGNWISLTVPLIKNSQGKEYLINIIPRSDRDAGQSFSTSEKNEYTPGYLEINNTYPDTDILFQYGCDTRK